MHFRKIRLKIKSTTQITAIWTSTLTTTIALMMIMMLMMIEVIEFIDRNYWSNLMPHLYCYMAVRWTVLLCQLNYTNELKKKNSKLNKVFYRHLPGWVYAPIGRRRLNTVNFRKFNFIVLVASLMLYSLVFVLDKISGRTLQNCFICCSTRKLFPHKQTERWSCEQLHWWQLLMLKIKYKEKMMKNGWAAKSKQANEKV